MPPTDGQLVKPEIEFNRLAVAPGALSRRQALANARKAVAALEPKLRSTVEDSIGVLLGSLSRALDAKRWSAQELRRAAAATVAIRDIGPMCGFVEQASIAQDIAELIEDVFLTGQKVPVASIRELYDRLSKLSLVS